MQHLKRCSSCVSQPCLKRDFRLSFLSNERNVPASPVFVSPVNEQCLCIICANKDQNPEKRLSTVTTKGPMGFIPSLDVKTTFLKLNSTGKSQEICF